MNKITYINYSHAEANRKIWQVLMERYRRIQSRNRLWSMLYFIAACPVFGVVACLSWFSYLSMLFKDVRFSLHYLQTEIRTQGMSKVQAQQYLDACRTDYIRSLSYGHISLKEQNCIEATFELLYKEFGLSDGKTMAEEKEAERQQQMEERLAKRKQTMHNREKGRMLDSFEETLSDAQMERLLKCCNEVPLFCREIERFELDALLACEHHEPLPLSVNKYIALLFDLLRHKKLVCATWMRVAEKRLCFVSKQGKPITSKDLSSALSTASLIDPKIEECIRSHMCKLSVTWRDRVILQSL